MDKYTEPSSTDLTAISPLEVVAEATHKLSEIAQTTLAQLSRRSPKDVSELTDLWEVVLQMRSDEPYQRKDLVYQDVGVLLIAGEKLAKQILRIARGEIDTVKFKSLALDNKMDWVQSTGKRMRKQPQEHILAVENTRDRTLAMIEEKNLGHRARDLGLLMQMKEDQATEVLRRLQTAVVEYKKMEEEKKKSEEEDLKGEENFARSSEATPDGVVAKNVLKSASEDNKFSPEETERKDLLLQNFPLSIGQESLQEAPKDASSKDTAKSSSKKRKRNKKKKHRSVDEDASASERQDAPKEKKPKKIYVPWVGEWKCALCNFWNDTDWSTCLGTQKDPKDKSITQCDGQKSLHTAEVQQDDGQHKKFHDPDNDPDIFAGDWQCHVCSEWKKSFWTECRRCGYCKNARSRVMPTGPNKKPRPVVVTQKLYNPGFA